MRPMVDATTTTTEDPQPMTPRIPSDDPKVEVGSFDRVVAERNSQAFHDEVSSELASIAMGRLRARADLPAMLAKVREIYEERCAIREHLGGYKRWEAERLGVGDTYEAMGIRTVPKAEVPAAWRKPKQRGHSLSG